MAFLHAAGGAARNFGSVVRRVPGSRAIDLPGHGKAGGDALRTIDEMADWVLGQVEPGTVLAGHSMGGAVALTAAARAPERVPGVVLMGTGARLGTSRALAEKARNDWPGFLAALAAGGTPPMTVKQLEQTGQETVARDLEAVSGGPDGRNPWNGLALAPRVKQPVLLIAGEHDHTSPPATVRELARALGTNAKYVELKDTGHITPVERPEEVAREVNAFLESLPLASTGDEAATTTA